MQTFLPYTDPQTGFAKSAEVLDRQRLGKQRVETMQILSALTGYKWDNDLGSVIKVKPSGWANHPATRMWRGYEFSLTLYGVRICEEWVKRGYKDTCLDKTRAIYNRYALKELGGFGKGDASKPYWLDYHMGSQYRALLLSKNPDHYGQFGWTEAPCDTIEYPAPRE